MSFQPKIYVACLAAYNNGFLHGRWIDVDDPDQVRSDIQQVLQTSPIPHSEEWAIHDSNGFGRHISEFESIDKICKMASFIGQTGPIAVELLNYTAGDVDEAERLWNDCYQGSASSYSEWLEDFMRSVNDPIPAWLDYYIDWNSMAYDFSCNGDHILIEVDGETHVFNAY